MTTQRHTTDSDSSRTETYIPDGTFTINRLGKSVDLTPLLDSGAKHTVVYSAFAAALGIPSKIPSRRENDPLKKYAQHNEFLYRALNRFVSRGLLTRQNSVIDTMSPEPEQRKGVFWRASEAARQKKTPNLINELQNSKSSAKQPSSLTEQTAKHIALIPNRCGFLRAQAIKRISEITNPEWFIRNKQTKELNMKLTSTLKTAEKIFDYWDAETQNKRILLRNLRTDEYIEKPYKTRFNDDGRKLNNIRIYNTGIENSIKKYKDAIFLTLTTDPQIWLRPKGEKFKRHIKNEGKYSFDAEGQGGDLYQANRHESIAWRKWYEKFCHHEGHRVPYIRCVEFQENGLIHTHVLLFDCKWDMKWSDFAYQWGTKYKQGFLNKAYEVKNDGEKWTWKKYKPDDAKSRSPADYLKKYLIKSMYETSGFYMYWACNKRFFTMSESLRYFSFDEKIAADDWKKEHQAESVFEYVGSSESDAGSIKSAIDKYLRIKHGKPQPVVFDTGEPNPANRVDPLPDYPTRIKEIEDIENPDEIDDDYDAAYHSQLAAERKEREARRSRLRQQTKTQPEK